MFPNLEIRKKVLMNSLLLEYQVSNVLGMLLGIKEPKNSVSFGNKSTSLSFNQKINILLNIGALKSEDKSKFITFMEVRNQFMHNYDCNSYEECFNYLNGKGKTLLKTYPQNLDLSLEDSLKSAFSDLSNELININKLYPVLFQRVIEEAEITNTSRSHDAIHKAIDISMEEFNLTIKKLITEKDISTHLLSQLHTVTRASIYKNWKYEMDKPIDQIKSKYF